MKLFFYERNISFCFLFILIIAHLINKNLVIDVYIVLRNTNCNLCVQALLEIQTCFFPKVA
ncbi:uncharacterized protein DS421_2g42970 [Arachis hypogaea]|nr:uncharacterized protein DS421_2g42970 [Arachis hypogaea]